MLTIKNNHLLPWLNASLRCMLRRKKRLFKRARASKIWSPYRSFQKFCKRELRRAEWKFINNTIQEGLKNGNSKPFWRLVKARKQDNTGVSPLKKNGQLISDSQGKADCLLAQFKSVFTPRSSLPHPPLPSNTPTIEHITISINGVAKLLHNLQVNKAAGPDGIPNMVLKTLADDIAPALAQIFQVSLDTGKLPQDWLAANVACAFKKGDRHEAPNYRPISLTSVSCKILEHIIHTHIMSHLESQNILTKLNHGFRAGYSTETQLITTVNDLITSFDQGKQIDVAILDFSKAFDTVPHDRLLLKLDKYGIRGPIHDWLTSFLTERSMQVVVEGCSSQQTSVDSGVPQGTVLGPLLFLCHINDLPEAVKSQVRLFADDCLIYREITTFDDHNTLDEDLKRLEEWAEKWGMHFNASKCYTMSLGLGDLSSKFYSLNNTILKSVPTNPYLGILFTDDLTWSNHISNCTKKANSSLGFIRRNLKHCPKPCRRNAYLALVRPILEYGAAVWDPHLKKDIDKLERVQRSAARFIAGDYRTATPGFVTKILEQHQLPTLQQRREDLRLTLFFKIRQGLVPAIPPQNFLPPHQTGRLRRTTRDPDFVYQNPNDYVRNNQKCYQVPQSKTNQYKFSFLPRTTISWNSLPDSVVDQQTTEGFKGALARQRN